VGKYDDLAESARRDEKLRELLQPKLHRAGAPVVAAFAEEFRQEGRDVARALKLAHIAPRPFEEGFFAGRGWVLTIVGRRWDDGPSTRWRLRSDGKWLEGGRWGSLAVSQTWPDRRQVLDLIDEKGELVKDALIATNVPDLYVREGLFVGVMPLADVLRRIVGEMITAAARR
jgi:hypothetical protein